MKHRRPARPDPGKSAFEHRRRHAIGRKSVQSSKVQRVHRRPWRPVRTCALGALVGALLCSTSALGEAVPGGVHVLALEDDVREVSWQGRPVLILGRQALIGIALSTEPGTYVARLTGADGEREIPVRVRDKAYPEQHLTIANQRMVEPDAAALARIREERARQDALYLQFSQRDLDITPFVTPTQGPISSLFGNRRILNGLPRSPHSGLDLAAALGAAVQAPAAARVTLADDLYFNGNTLFLDHGQGLVSMYCHLDAMAVSAGESVTRGQIIGQVGATGRVTGPHLHWSVSLNGNRVDPLRLQAILNASASSSLATSQATETSRAPSRPAD